MKLNGSRDIPLYTETMSYKEDYCYSRVQNITNALTERSK